MKFQLLVVSLIMISFAGSSQGIYVGEKLYSATNTWGFDIKKSRADKLDISVAKVSKTKGYIMLSTRVPFEFSHIAGTVMLYLNNGAVLKLQNRVASDNVDDESIVVYSISLTQIKSLKESDIKTIRYSISEHGTLRNYTAENIGIDTGFRLPEIGLNPIVPFQTASEITKQFDGGKEPG